MKCKMFLISYFPIFSRLWLGPLEFCGSFHVRKKIPPAIVDLYASQCLSLLFLHFPILSYVMQGEVTRHSSLAGVNLLSQEVNLDGRGKGCTNIHCSWYSYYTLRSTTIFLLCLKLWKVNRFLSCYSALLILSCVFIWLLNI